MKRNKTRGFKRLLAFSLAAIIIICGANCAVLADAALLDDNTIIACNANGNITYETIQKQTTDNEEINSYACKVEVNMLDTSQIDEGISALTSSSLNKVQNTEDSPYRNVCYILAQYSDGHLSHSTGVLVGFNLVLVSAHGVYDNEHGGFATSITVAPGAYLDSNGNLQMPLGSAQNTGIRAPSGWVNSKKDSYDWALVGLNRSFTTYQIYGYAKDYTQAVNRNITIMGYPQGGDGIYYSSGTITGTTDGASNISNRGLWTTSATSQAGMSGGPVIDEATGAVIGIVKGEANNIFGMSLGNVSVPLTELVINTIKSYKEDLQ